MSKSPTHQQLCFSWGLTNALGIWVFLLGHTEIGCFTDATLLGVGHFKFHFIKAANAWRKSIAHPSKFSQNVKC